MVRKKIFFAFGLILFSFNLFSQDATDEKAKLKNEIAIDASPVLGAFVRNISQPGIVYRRHFSNSALRTKFNFNIDRQISNNSSFDNSYFSYNAYGPQSPVTNSYSFDYSIGIQNSNMISEKWKFYYGLDLISGYNLTEINRSSSYERLNYTDQTLVEEKSSQKDKNTTIYGGASPILGFTFQVKERLSISLESTLALAFYSTNVESLRMRKYRDSNTESIHHSSNNNSFNNLRARLIPVNNFLISYHF